LATGCPPLAGRRTTPGAIYWAGWNDSPRTGSPKTNKGSQRSPAEAKRCCMPGTRRSTETTMVVSSRTLPVAGIDFFASFRDDFVQFGAFGFCQYFETALDDRETLGTAGLAKPMNIIGRFFQFGSGERLQIFQDEFEFAHEIRVGFVDTSDKPVRPAPSAALATEVSHRGLQRTAELWKSEIRGSLPSLPFSAVLCAKFPLRIPLIWEI
jgi:hypothetical protein